MFCWHHNAAKCYVYLSDISVGEDYHWKEQRCKSDFQKSRWFTRGWTLQELLAPKSVDFFSRERRQIGDKLTLERPIHETTQIPVSALRGTPLSDFSANERMRWIATRDTKRKEDKVYCLMGIFNVFIPLIYSEGDNALTGLMGEVERSARTVPPPSLSPSIVIPYRRDRDFIEPDVLGEI